jgi:cytoskeleton protein RodZ
MNDGLDVSVPDPDRQTVAQPVTAGSLLRAARQAQGLHMAALATTLKVAPRKLDALENDRYDELQGAAFVRALAQATCRALKLDPAQVMLLLPRPDSQALERVGGGLNAPFRQVGVRREPTESLLAHRGLMGLVAILVLAAVGLWWMPAEPWQRIMNWWGPSATTSLVTAVPESAASDVVMASQPVLAEPTAESPAVPVSAGVPASAAISAIAPMPPGTVAAVVADKASAMSNVAEQTSQTVPSATGNADRPSLQLRAREPSWVEVVDGKGQLLIGRLLATDESVALVGTAPFRVKIGNVKGTELSLRGQPVDLAAQTRDNVARLELR